MVAIDAQVDFTYESDSFILCDAFAQGSRGCRVPEQLGSDDNVVAGVPCEFLMLLPLGVAFFVLDEVDDVRSPVGVNCEHFLS